MTSNRKESLDLTSPNAVNYTIPDLISHLQHTFLPGDFNRVIDILSAKEEKTKNDYSLLEEQHADLQLSNLQMEDELKASKKVNAELRERLLRAKDEIKGMERRKRAAEELLNLYKSRFDMLMMRVTILEDDARVLMFDRARDEEEEMRGTDLSSNASLMHDHIGETQGQVTEEMACVSNKKKKDDPSTSTTDPAMPVKTEPKIEPEVEAVNITQQGSETIIVKNEMVSPSNGRNSTKVVVEIIDSDDEQPMVVKPSASRLKRKGVSPFGGVDEDGSRSYSQIAGGGIKVPQDLDIKLKKVCGSQRQTAPTTSRVNDVEASGTSSKQNSGILRTCEEKIRSKLTSDQLMSEINKFACEGEDSSSDESEDDNVDWKNKEDMIMALEKDPELCMKAICALYRERSFNSLEFHNTQIDEKCTALRGTALAEFLINGDPQAKLKRSAVELWQKDEKGLHDCQRIAKVYSKKLFEIYKKGRDTNAFLPPFY